MAQAVWSGSISFGLVNVPVRLYPATRRKDVRFHELDRVTGRRVRHQRVRYTEPDEFFAAPFAAAAPAAPAPEQPRVSRAEAPRAPEPPAEVEREQLVKGYEVAPDQYVTVTREELESLAPEKSRTIDVEQFASAADIDPIYFDASYYVVPTVEGARAFALLLDALADTKKVALGWFTLRTKRHLAAIRPHSGVMLLSTMLHADEVLAAPTAPSVDGETLTEREKNMAKLLVDTLSGPFEPDRYRDEYRERVLELIRGRTPSPLGGEVQEGWTPTQGVEDLMAALQASIEAAKAQRQDEQPKQRRAK
jgi:DNA end-binding protein Ku